MSPSKERRLGVFYVRETDSPEWDERMRMIRIAQEGGAVLHAECLDYARSYRFVMDHPLFDPAPGYVVPEYECEFHKGVRGEIIRTFRRKETSI
jgi:hypothetical protein